MVPQALLDRERVGARQDQVRGVSVAKVVQSDAPETRALHVRVEHLAHAVNPESAAELEREAAQLPIPIVAGDGPGTVDLHTPADKTATDFLTSSPNVTRLGIGGLGEAHGAAGNRDGVAPRR